MKSKPLTFLLAIIVSLLINQTLFAQNVGINATGATPNASAGLDVDFTNMGILIPRMTTAQRNAVATPATSLMIFNTTTNCLEIYIGGWQSIYCGCLAAPTAPVANAASSVLVNGFTANWASATGATGYFLDVATDIGFTLFVAGYNNLNVGNVTGYSVSGLTCGVTYYYRVRAMNLCGTSANSNIITQATISCCPASYAVTSIAFAPIAGVGTGVVLSDDQTSTALPIGFNFCFYGTTYTQFVISSNGFISFDLAAPNGCCSGVATPSAGLPNNAVSVCWTDLYPPGGGSVDYFVSGVSPNRKLVVRWNSVPEYSCGGNFNGQIILCETTNVIETHTTSCNMVCHTMEVGVENSTGTLGTGAPARNTATNPVFVNEAWRFQ